MKTLKQLLRHLVDGLLLVGGGLLYPTSALRYIRTSVHASIHPSVHPSMRACMHAYLHIPKHMYMQTYARACMCMYIYIHIHTYIHTYIYVDVQGTSHRCPTEHGALIQGDELLIT